MHHTGTHEKSVRLRLSYFFSLRFWKRPVTKDDRVQQSHAIAQDESTLCYLVVTFEIFQISANKIEHNALVVFFRCDDWALRRV